ncbi:MAG TPA: calcium-binding protein [Solirubrobacteraceae bacterium]|jgi:hypothetical protein
MTTATRIAAAAIALAMAAAVPAGAKPTAGEPHVKAAAAAAEHAPAGRAPAVRPVQPPKATLDILRDRRGPKPRTAPPTLASGGKTEPAMSTTAGEAFWSWGTTEQQWGLNCSIIENPYYEPQVTSQVGYGGTQDVPKVGERFNIVLLYSHPGYACSGGFLADVYSELRMSDGAQLAIDAQHGISCFTNTRADPDTWVDVTNSTWSTPSGTKGKWCETGGGIGMHGGYNMGLRMMVTGTIFQIVIPAIATKELKGAANVPAVAKFQGTTESVIAISTHRLAYPEVWANVLGYSPASVGYPAPSATEITPTSAKLTGYVYNHYNGGTARIEIGPTTAYGTTSDAATISPDFDANMMWATWSGLKPATTYHWRVKYTNPGGTVTNGPDQTFTTPGAAVVSKTGSTLTMTAYGLRANRFQVLALDGRYGFKDSSGGAVVPGAGCTAVQSNMAMCDGAGITGLTVDGGAYADTITIESGIAIKATLKGGSGNDTLTGGAEPDTFDGGIGADTLTGGGGTDTATYAFRLASQPVNVSLDGVENDGGAVDVSGTRKDNVKADVENVNGGAGADTLTGSSGPNVLTGGPGSDTLRGMEGADRVLGFDNAVDAVIDCGTGADRASVDLTPLDPATAGCETVTKF